MKYKEALIIRMGMISYLSLSSLLSALSSPLDYYKTPHLSDSLPQKKQHSWHLLEQGISTGYGYGVNASSLPEGSYSPIFLQGILGFSFKNLDIKNTGKAKFELILEPQINLILLRSQTGNSVHSEAGVGVGLQEMYPLGRNLYPFIRVVAGPHYFSTSTSEQARGFLFSDNVAAGIYWFSSPHWAIHAEYRARHLSNANLMLPNHGINTFNFLIGLSHFIH